MSPTIPLGPFDLVAPIARGGMGQVWRAVHRRDQVPVAIKVVTSRFDADRDYLIAKFRDEIRAVAALEHPGVVMILDNGEVGDRAAAHSQGRLRAGWPWLAMELCTGGTLSRHSGKRSWRRLKSLLLALLDALAHAHARDVVHLDLKPSNVLVATRSDLRPGLKLSDFGIAQALRERRTGDDDDLVGTPMYMSPEQIAGAWRDYGPWTDLYSLGCLIHPLSGGESPYRKQPTPALIAAQLFQKPRDLHPKHPAPDGFLDWVDWLLRKDHRERFQTAADAAAALIALGDPEHDTLPGQGEGEPEDDTLLPTAQSLGETWRLQVQRSVLPNARTRPALRGAPVAAVLPPDWRRPLPAPTSTLLIGAGLGLYGLRSLPVVGRELEQDQLWDALAVVKQTGAARAVVISGTAGTGKSRLVRWLCERAREVGAADFCKATFSPDLSPGRALQQLGMDYFRSEGLARSEVSERVRQVYARFGAERDTHERAVLTELLCPSEGEDAGGVRLTRPQEYYQGVRATMARAAAERPLIVWLDDVQWGPHGLGLALQVLRTQADRPFPALILCTLRTDAVADEGEEAHWRLEKFMAHPLVAEIRLDRLPAVAHASLVRRLLGLDGRLAAEVEERTAGNPLFAVQLVGDWVQRGILVPTTTGFALADGADAALPDDLHEVWGARIDEVLLGFPEHTRPYLEVAAVLGHEVNRSEWRQACDDPAGLFGDRFRGDEGLRCGVVERLLQERLAVGTLTRWSFVHGMLRESLQRSARDASRLGDHHEACATMLARQSRTPTTQERIGRHLLAAGAHERALEPLFHGVEHRLVTVGPKPALALLRQTEQAMGAAGLAETDRRWAQLWTLRGRLFAASGAPTEAATNAQRALAAARAHGWSEERMVAVGTLAEVALSERDPAEAGRWFRELNRLATRANDRRFLGRARVGLADLQRRSGDPTGAAAQLERAATDFVWSQDAAGLANCRRLRGRCFEALGQPREALEAYESARDTYARIGGGLGIAECQDRLGRIHRRQGAVDAAVEALRQAVSLFEALGSEKAFTSRMRLVSALIAASCLAEAGRVVEGARSSIGLLPHADRVNCSFALQLVVAATSGDWTRWDRLVPDLLAHIPRRGVAPGIVAWLLRLAAEAAEAQGEGRAAVAKRSALMMFSAIGDAEQVKELS